jgi:hypothetical protein
MRVNTLLPPGANGSEIQQIQRWTDFLSPTSDCTPFPLAARGESTMGRAHGVWEASSRREE